MSIRFFEYSGCSGCRSARKWLDAHGVTVTAVPIVEKPPSVAELKTWLGQSGLELKRFFNTSGEHYRTLGLSARLPEMTEAEALQLLTKNGKLIKRPLLVDDSTGRVMVGFKPETYAQFFSKG